MALSEDLGMVPSMGGHFNKYKTAMSLQALCKNVLCKFVDVQNMKVSKIICNIRQVTSYNVHPWWWQDADKQYVIITAKLGLHTDPGP